MGRRLSVIIKKKKVQKEETKSSNAALEDKGASTDKADKAADKDKVPSGFKKRLKALLKEPENAVCSECCSHKPKWGAILKVLKSSTDQKIGIFCCNHCHVNLETLGEELCILKSLKALHTCKVARVAADGFVFICVHLILKYWLMKNLLSPSITTNRDGGRH